MEITVRTTGEKYRVYPTGKKIVNAVMVGDQYIGSHAAPSIDHDHVSDALRHALTIAGQIGCPILVDRVTFYDPATVSAGAGLFGVTSCGYEVTGSIDIDIMAFMDDPEMSRYHPNNGWVVPKTIKVTI